jgi:hypothetical protein
VAHGERLAATGPSRWPVMSGAARGRARERSRAWSSPRARRYKGVEVRQPQAAAQAVQRKGQRQGTVNLVVSRLAEWGRAGSPASGSHQPARPNASYPPMSGSTISSTSAATMSPPSSIEPPGPRPSRPGLRLPALPLWHSRQCAQPEPRPSSRPRPHKLTVPASVLGWLLWSGLARPSSF